MTPSLSVVVPTRDTCALTVACLGTLAADLPPDAEIVVVDDASRDDTAAVVARAHPAVRLVRLAPARGFAAAANAGLALARGRILWLLNSDTEVACGAIAALLAAFEASPRLGAAGAALRCPDGTPQWSGGRFPTPRWLFALASGGAAAAARVPGYRRVRPVAGHDAAAVEWIPATALALRAEAWRAVGPLDETFRLYAQDLDLCMRLRAAGFEVAIVQAARVMHHGGATVRRVGAATAASHDPALLWSDLVRAVRKHRGDAAATTALRALHGGAALRLVARAIALPFVPAARRAAWRRDTDVYRRARAALTTSA